MGLITAEEETRQLNVFINVVTRQTNCQPHEISWLVDVLQGADVMLLTVHSYKLFVSSVPTQFIILIRKRPYLCRWKLSLNKL